MSKNRSQSQRRRHSQRRHDPNRKPNGFRNFRRGTIPNAPIKLKRGAPAVMVALDEPPSYDDMTVTTLREEAKKLGIKGTWRMTKPRLLEAIREREAETLQS